MKVGIINIGDEILIGQILNTNSKWIAEKLVSIGVEVTEMTTIGDNEKDITNITKSMLNNNDVVITTGGLGPTKDDITMKCFSKLFKSELVFSDKTYQNIIDWLNKRGRQINELTKNQAIVPQKARVIQNKVGTAPILIFEENNKLLISLPGVPTEMKFNIEHEILPILKSRNGELTYECRHLLLHKIAESNLAMILDDFESSLPNDIQLAYLPSHGYIKLRLFSRNTKNATSLDKQYRRLKELTQNYYLSNKEISISRLLLDKLEYHGLSISTAESCTGGLIGNMITQEAGASKSYNGSIIAYCNKIKHKILNIPLSVLDTDGAVSKKTVELMANNVADIFGTQASISISGIAGPGGGTVDKPVGTVWICTRLNNETIAKKYIFGSDRETNILSSANSAILQMISML